MKITPGKPELETGLVPAEHMDLPLVFYFGKHG